MKLTGKKRSSAEMLDSDDQVIAIKHQKIKKLSSENCSDDENELASLPTGAGLNEEDEFTCNYKGLSHLALYRERRAQLRQTPISLDIVH